MKGLPLEGYRSETVTAFEAVNLETVQEVADLLLAARRSSRFVYIAGNGGSSATASHMATDLMLGSGLKDPALRIVSLSDNQAIVTATGNDLSFDDIFSRQLRAMGRSQDVLIVVTASGNSTNIVRAVETARDLGMITVGLTGFDGGVVKGMVDFSIHVPTTAGAYGPVEDVHLAINHMITKHFQVIAAQEIAST